MFAAIRFNWKTSLFGLTSILSGLGLVGAALKPLTETPAGAPDVAGLKTGGAAIVVGFGLLFAKDGDKTGLAPAAPKAAAPGFIRLGFVAFLAFAGLALLSGCAGHSFVPNDNFSEQVGTTNGTPINLNVSTGPVSGTAPKCIEPVTISLTGISPACSCTYPFPISEPSVSTCQ